MPQRDVVVSRGRATITGGVPICHSTWTARNPILDVSFFIDERWGDADPVVGTWDSLVRPYVVLDAGHLN